MQLVSKMIALSPAQKRAVSSSRSWALPKDKLTGRWKRVGRVTTTIQRAKAIVTEFSLDRTRTFRVGQDVTGFEFDVGDDMGEGTELLEALRKALEVGLQPSDALHRPVDARVPVP